MPRADQPTLALVTHVAPEAPWSGERRRVAAAYAYLSGHFDCDLVVSHRADGVLGRLLRQLRHPVAPPYCSRFASPNIDLNAYDLIWVFELWSLASVPRRLWNRVLLDKDTLMADSYAESSSIGARLMRRWIGWYEGRALGRVKHAFVSLPKAGMGEGDQVTHLPNGYEPPPGGPRPRRERDGSVRLGFVGLLGFEPNRRALMWFASEVLPHLRKQEDLARVELWVAGGSLPAADARALSTVTGVTVCGYVEDIADFYAEIDLAVAPLLGGVGTPTKVVEALGHEKPVIGTPKGLRGLDPPLRQWCIEVQGDAWASAIRAGMSMLATQPPSAGNLIERYSWSAVFEQAAAPYIRGSHD
jgi:glycosyltransferase involved in cell wall biosynthesis